MNEYGREFSLKEFLIDGKFCVSDKNKQRKSIDSPVKEATIRPQIATNQCEVQDLSNQYYDMKSYHEEYYPLLYAPSDALTHNQLVKSFDYEENKDLILSVILRIILVKF